MPYDFLTQLGLGAPEQQQPALPDGQMQRQAMRARLLATYTPEEKQALASAGGFDEMGAQGQQRFDRGQALDSHLYDRGQARQGRVFEGGQARLDQQLAQANALRTDYGSHHHTGLGSALGMIADGINSGTADRQQEQLRGQMDAKDKQFLEQSAGQEEQYRTRSADQEQLLAALQNALRGKTDAVTMTQLNKEAELSKLLGPYGAGGGY